ncbi:hypothetical protein DVH24_025270 [Malus domestica]|uniref:AAA+ ATPase domain-containing protein n=1 Tax=Malus domestica TaxID=3750 RepID=A0A498HLH0_MALDO|nr:hypothetical protein DVH24_025270 [Malus domestica]
MAQLAGADEIESFRLELAEIGRSIRSSFRSHASSLRSTTIVNAEGDNDEGCVGDEEHDLHWAAVERLPTFERITTALFDDYDGESAKGDVKGRRVVDVSTLGGQERRVFIERLIKHIENDNLQLLQKIKQRIDKVGVKLPTVEVRYENLCVEAECKVVHGKPLPTLWNALKGMILGIAELPGSKTRNAKISILEDVSGIIKPGRMTLLLGPPGCGKTTFLMALAGKLSHSLKVSGELCYNGHGLEEFVPQKTSAYVSQQDVHIPEITVRETLDFSACCQGVGSRPEIMMEVSRREKQAGIVPDPDVDAYMKATSVKGLKNTLQTDYILKILGLDFCADTSVGDPIRRGISGGQKKRLTTGSLVIISSITMTVFLRTRMAIDLIHANYYMGSLFYGLVILLVDGFPELSMTVSRIVVFYKQKELCFYPAWAYAIPAAILKVPLSCLEAFVWTALTYYVIGYTPEVGRFFRQFLLLFAMHLTSISMFRFIASVFQTVGAAMTAGTSSILAVLLFGGFVIPKSYMPAWIKWGFWVSPLTYGEIGLTVNEFLAPRWEKVYGNTTLSLQVLESRGLNFEGYFYWISLGALVGFTVLFNVGFTLALTFLKSPGRPPAIISYEKYRQLQGKGDKKTDIDREHKPTSAPNTTAEAKKGRMVLPFEPLAVAFQDVQYYVDTPLLILMKTGGHIIYCGPLGQNSSEVIEYFESIPRVPSIKDNYNPATWMLEVTSKSVESELGIDFAQIYRESALYGSNKDLAKQLCSPSPGSNEMHFATRFPQNGWGQFKACLWKQNLSYWRSPSYNLTRIIFMFCASLLFGILFWDQGNKINSQQDLFNMYGSMFCAVIFFGINNCSTVLPYVATERNVLYRERFAGMFSSWAYSFAQVLVEVPYAFTQAVIYVAITYPMIGYQWSAYKIFWSFYSMFCILLSFNYLGMLIVSLTPNVQVAAIVASASYAMLNLFSGFVIPRLQIPKWWLWLYYLSPTSWALNGMLTPQYGDMQKEIQAFGETKTVAAFLEDYFGFDYNLLGLVAAVSLLLPIAFASLFAYFIGKLNFQRR